ncbi:MAG: MerR family transcriptional regulator [Gammaproteobacteria bacterium]
MPSPSKPEVPGLPIASAERETGLSKDTLRVWERRYGFPAPTRDAHGERLYAPEQVRQLARIKRLMDRGHRPGKLMAMDADALAALDATPGAETAPQESHLDAWLNLVKTHDIDGLARQFHSEVARRGLASFVQDVAAPLITRVGEAWSRNELGIFEEHLFSQHLEKLFRLTLANMAPQAGHPRVLLTTLSGEEHTLGLLMVEALLTVEGAYPLLLGPQTPIDEIVRAARVKDVDAVCLSFSSAYSSALAAQGLRDLRQALPAAHALWAGGYGIRTLRKPIEGVCLLPEFDDLYACLAAWRQEKGGKPAD